MKQIMKKVPLLIALSLGAFTCAHAATTYNSENAQVRNLDNRVTALEQRKTAGGMINPQGRPQVRDGADLFVFANFLYWNAHENGLQVAIKNLGSDDTLSNARTEILKGKWNPAFRVGIGYNLPHDGWDIKLTWLRFTDNGSINDSTTPPNYLFPSRIPAANMPAGVDVASSVASHWRMRLDQLDLDMGREFFVSKWLTMRPHFGLRADWLRQSVTANYALVTPVEQNNTDVHDRWYGLGLEAGLDTQWGLGSGWSLFGNLCTSILYGFHKITDLNPYTPAGGTVINYMDLKSSARISQPILDIEAGIRWDNMFSNDRFHLGLQLGWEHHIYFSQNQLPIFTSDTSPGTYVTNQGDLALQGWTFAARFDF